MAGERTANPQGRIVELPQDTVRLIGSTQVITSVFSVVKELAENSVDAGATIIEVKLDKFGLEKIEVLDNGKGVNQTDIQYVAKRHYTSKLKTTDDLLSLNTYGFRGEALGSLCAVSDLKITTKRKEDDISFTYSFDKEGTITDKKPSHVGQGTCVCARNLFYNLPVRKQYYSNSKHRKDDLKKVEDFLMVLGVVVPPLRITLRHDKEVVWQKLSMTDTKTALQHVLGRQVVNQMLFLKKELQDSKISVSAFIPKPGSDVKAMSRSSNDRMYIVVNSRPVHMKELSKILKQYYSNCHDCESLRHPVCYVSVELPSDSVDVNVDPNKTQVFLQHLVEVRNCLEEILLEVYGPLENVPSWRYSEPDKASKNKDINENEGKKGLPLKIGSSENFLQLLKENRNQRVSEGTIVNNVGRNKEAGSANAIDSGGDLKSQPLQTSLTSNNFTSSSSSDNVLIEERKNETIIPVASESMVQIPASKGSSVNTVMDIADKDLLEIFSEEPSSSPSENLSTLKPPGSELTTEIVDKEPSENISDNSILEIIPEAASNKTPENFSCDKQKPSVAESSSVCEKIDSTLSKDERENTGISWSRGTSLLDKDGNIIQPVQLLPPTPFHRPGKRPPSPSSSAETQSKIAKLQTTSKTSNTFIERPESPYTHYCKENRLQFSQSHPNQDEDQLTNTLRESWSALKDDEKVKYKDMHWQQVKRYEKQTSAIKNDVISKKKKQVDVREAVRAMASQSQSEKKKKVLKRRLYSQEMVLSWDLKRAKPLIEQLQQIETEVQPSSPVVVGYLGSHDLWSFLYGSLVKVVKADRLREQVIFQDLMAKHRLKSSSCATPVILNDSLEPDAWPVFEKLALKECETSNAMPFSVQDERIVANGFDIKCHLDNEGHLQAVLIGLCNYIPTYGPGDLNEVLKKICNCSEKTLEQTRPLKVLYYLQGEAVRLAHQPSNKKTSPSDLEEKIKCLQDITDTATSFNHKTIIHTLVSMSDLL